jgi:hypothetical protein
MKAMYQFFFRGLRNRRPAPFGKQVVQCFAEQSLNIGIFFKSNLLELSRDSWIKKTCNGLLSFPARSDITREATGCRWRSNFIWLRYLLERFSKILLTGHVNNPTYLYVYT